MTLCRWCRSYFNISNHRNDRNGPTLLVISVTTGNISPVLHPPLDTETFVPAITLGLSTPSDSGPHDADSEVTSLVGNEVFLAGTIRDVNWKYALVPQIHV